MSDTGLIETILATLHRIEDTMRIHQDAIEDLSKRLAVLELAVSDDE